MKDELIDNIKKTFDDAAEAFVHDVHVILDSASRLMAEQTAHNREVEGSNPPGRTKKNTDIYAPICWACQVEMQVYKVGVTVVHYAYDDPPIPYSLQDADILRCPSCAYMIYGRFGEPIHDLDKAMKMVTHDKNPPRRVYRSMYTKQNSMLRNGYGPSEDHSNFG